MKKVLGSLALFGILATGGMVYADDYEDCMTFWNWGEYKEAIKAGKLAIKKHPKDLGGYECLAGVYRKTGKLDLAYETMKKAEKIAHSKQDLMNVYREIAGILRDMGKLDDALTYYNKTLNLARDLKDSFRQVSTIRDIADVYFRKGDLDKALSYNSEALNLETIEIGKAVICSNIADIYDKKGDHQKSIEYRQKAIGYIQQAAKEGYLDEVYEKIYIGGIYQGMKDYKTAEKYFLEALNRAKKNEDKEGEANAYIALGDLYEDMGDKKRTKKYYQRAYKALKSFEASPSINDKHRFQISNEADEVLKKIKELDKSK